MQLTRRQMIQVGAGASLLLARGARAEDAIRIGAILSLSGPAAAYGLPERDIVTAFINNFNARGGINGRKLELVLHDDRTDTTEAARGASKLVRQDGVVAIIGSTTGN